MKDIKKYSISSISNSKGIHIIDPTIIYFTHSRIRPYFTGCNKRIEETLQDIIDQRITFDHIPLITVIENNGSYFSLNNRRLYLIKQLIHLEILKYHNNPNIPKNKIQVYIKPALDREKLRYTIEKCSLVAKIMKEYTDTSPTMKNLSLITENESSEQILINDDALINLSNDHSNEYDNMNSKDNDNIINIKNNHLKIVDMMITNNYLDNTSNKNDNINNKNDNISNNIEDSTTSSMNKIEEDIVASRSNNSSDHNIICKKTISNIKKQTIPINNNKHDTNHSQDILLINNKIILKEINKTFPKLIKTKTHLIISKLDEWLDLNLINEVEYKRISEYFNIN